MTNTAARLAFRLSMRLSVILVPLAVLCLVSASSVSSQTFDDLTVDTSIDKSAYSWFGTVTVTAFVSLIGSPIPDCDSIVVTCGANPEVQAYLKDDGIPPDALAGDSQYTGYFLLGGDLGEARPPTFTPPLALISLAAIWTTLWASLPSKKPNEVGTPMTIDSAA